MPRQLGSALRGPWSETVSASLHAQSLVGGQEGEIRMTQNTRQVLAISALLACAGTQAATQIDILSTNPFGTTLSLAAGAYSLSYIGKSDGGAYDAWTAWSADTDCGGGPGSCPRGFINELRIEGIAPEPIFVGDHFTVIWDTELQALDAARTRHSPLTLTLPNDVTVRFLVGESAAFGETGVDGPAWQDNSGGLSLTISAVPEPAALALLLAGLGTIGIAARSRRASA
jgi:hypothetical protein